ncbi:MAG: transcription antitermination factor NusB [Saprospiraceae bacterium]|nr:transcription antitermination factor NusB [Saprospiraceae bacterium]
MLSRRNIRIKVMQVLYAMSRDKELSFRHAMLLYNNSIRQSFEMYLFNVLQLVRVAEYAKIDYNSKLAKHRPTDEDKAFRPKLCDNEIIRSIQDNRGFKTLLTTQKILEKMSEDDTRYLYNEFAKTEDYIEFLASKDDSPEFYRQAMLNLYKHFNGSEHFNEMVEDRYFSWYDDKSLIVGAMKKTLKALPASGDFYSEFEPTDETVKEFGEILLQKVNSEDKELLEIIEPALKNWDAERVAILDMILLKMALCELMTFNTIPTKVTLNEYVEISKQYSTDKSKDFINGILDRLMKKLEKEGRIVKEGRGLIEE